MLPPAGGNRARDLLQDCGVLRFSHEWVPEFTPILPESMVLEFGRLVLESGPVVPESGPQVPESGPSAGGFPRLGARIQWFPPTAWVPESGGFPPLDAESGGRGVRPVVSLRWVILSELMF